jgi:hypothetical protein
MSTSYEERKKERESEDQRRERKNKLYRFLKRGVWWLILLFVAGAIFWWARTLFPQGEDRSAAFPILGQDHIQIGASHPDYNSNPPTSGWHYAQPAETGFYNRELPDEQLVHNLEHGEIWISYRPGLDQTIVNKLKGYVGIFVIVTERAKNDSDIALAAWGRLDGFNVENGVLDEQRIKDFILRYQDKGPEKVHMITP